MEGITLKEIIKNQKIITLSVNDNIKTALDKLAENNILSAPIIEPNNKNKIYGFVDILDILVHLVKESTKTLFDLTIGESKNLSNDDLKMIWKRSKDFNLTNVKNIIDISKRNKFIILNEKENIFNTLKIFSQEKVHRIAIMDINENIIGVISQSAFIRFLFKENLISKIIKDIPIHQLNYITKENKLINISPNIRTIDAFMIMYENNLSALPIVDESTNILLGTLSSSDLRNLREKEFNELLKSVREFIYNIRENQGKDKNYMI
jgi:5'-AMP-activated protein kinase regulatory gamma subunit